jgi:glycosyl transferase family 87
LAAELTSNDMSSAEARTGRESLQRAGAAAAFLFAIGYFLYNACKFRIASLVQLSGDASIIFRSSLTIAGTGRYPAQSVLGNFTDIFPYPPPAVLMFAVLAKLGPTIFMTVIEVLTFVALFAVVRLCVVYEDRAVARLWPLLLLPVILLTYNPIEYDLFGRNVNLTILALTLSSFALLRRAPIASGVVLALAISLKLYSGLLLIWLILFNRKAAISCIAALAALWIVAPVLYWGGAGAVQIYRDWFDQLAIANGSWVYALAGTGRGPPLITLRLAAARLLAADPFGSDVRHLLLLLQAIWLAVLALYGYRAWRRPGKGDRRAMLADWFVLLAAPLPFSPWFEPYHAVAVIPGFVLCMLFAADRNQNLRARSIMVLACIASAVVKELPIAFEMRGLVFTAQFMFVILALSTIRPDLSVETGLPASAVA